MRGDKLVTGRHYAAPRQFGRVVKPTVGLCRSKSFPLTRVFSFVETVLPRPTQMGDNMAEVLKLFRETAFAPEAIEVLAAALNEAWATLEQSGSKLTRPAYSRVMREVVAKRIMEMAERGVQDREVLVTDAIQFIAANYQQPSTRAK